MKIIWGPPVENPGFNAETEGWILFREPNPRVSPFFEFPFSLAMGAGIFLLLRENNGFSGFSGNLLFAIPQMLFSIVIHELFHSLGHPGFGLGSETRYGIWISRMAFYSRFEGMLSRDRRLLITLLPFFGLTITPIGLLLFLNLYWWPLSFMALFNALFSARDLLNSGIILMQAPSDSILHDNGWRTYWRKTQPDRNNK